MRQEKAKLDLAGCKLDDVVMKFLVEALASKPMIAKLDLTSNDFSDEVWDRDLINTSDNSLTNSSSCFLYLLLLSWLNLKKNPLERQTLDQIT